MKIFLINDKGGLIHIGKINLIEWSSDVVGFEGGGLDKGLEHFGDLSDMFMDMDFFVFFVVFDIFLKVDFLFVVEGVPVGLRVAVRDVLQNFVVHVYIIVIMNKFNKKCKYTFFILSNNLINKGDRN